MEHAERQALFQRIYEDYRPGGRLHPGTVPVPSARDYEWIERELGDVEYRATALVYMGPLMPCVPIPVESLGRDE